MVLPLMRSPSTCASPHASTPARSGKGPIPIPVVERVTSPWALAEQVPATQPSQSQASQPPEAAAAAAEGATGRPSMGGLPPRAGRRGSLLAVSNVRRASGATPGGGAAASGATPSSAAQPSPVDPNPTGQEGKLPTPWSTLRPWDGMAAQSNAAAAAEEAEAEAPAASGDENQAGPPQQLAAAGQQADPADGKQQQGNKPGGRTRRAARHAAEPPAEAESDAPGPTHGCIALTSVDPAVVELARSATRRLRGLRLCPEGREEGQVGWGAAAVWLGGAMECGWADMGGGGGPCSPTRASCLPSCAGLQGRAACAAAGTS